MAQLVRDSGAQSVVVDSGVVLAVRRGAEEACVRVAEVSGFPANGALRAGAFLVGAALGSARLSFIKMPAAMVENELARLRATRKAYSLLVAESLPEDAVASLEQRLNLPAGLGSPSSSAGTPGRARPGSAYRAAPSSSSSGSSDNNTISSSNISSIIIGSRSNNNPQELTPAVPRFDVDIVSPVRGKARTESANTDASLDCREQSSNSPLHSAPGSPHALAAAQAPHPSHSQQHLQQHLHQQQHERHLQQQQNQQGGTAAARTPAGAFNQARQPQEHADGLSSLLQFGDLGRFQQSLHKLRSQRFAIERLRADLAARDARVAALERDHEQQRAALEAAQAEADQRARLEGELGVARDHARALERRSAEREVALEALRASASAAEDFLRSAVAQEQQAREQERSNWGKQEEVLREQLAVARLDAQGEGHRADALEGELQEARLALAEAAAAEEGMRAVHAEQSAALRRALEAAQADRDELFAKLAAARTESEAAAVALKATREALAAAEQRASLLAGTVEELEQNVALLRKQLVEGEQRQAARLTDAHERARAAEKQLAFKSSQLDAAERRAEQAKEALRAEQAELAGVKQLLARADKEADNRRLQTQRLQAALEQADERLRHSAQRTDQLHARALEERARASLLEQRLEAERRQCAEWASARLDLLDQFCEEEHKMRGVTTKQL
jgi:hypothetical protein